MKKVVWINLNTHLTVNTNCLRVSFELITCNMAQTWKTCSHCKWLSETPLDESPLKQFMFPVRFTCDCARRLFWKILWIVNTVCYLPDHDFMIHLAHNTHLSLFSALTVYIRSFWFLLFQLFRNLSHKVYQQQRLGPALCFSLLLLYYMLWDSLISLSSTSLIQFNLCETAHHSRDTVSVHLRHFYGLQKCSWIILYWFYLFIFTGSCSVGTCHVYCLCCRIILCLGLWSFISLTSCL